VFGELEKNIPSINFDTSFKICKYLVPKGYPEQKIKKEIDFSNLGDRIFEDLYLGGVSFDTDNRYRMTGSRILAMVSSNEKEIDSTFKQIKGHIHWRTDITERYKEKVESKQVYLDIDLVTKSLEEQKTLIKSTYNDMVLSNETSFGGMFSLDSVKKLYIDPVLVSSTDGVGTKTRFIYNHLGAEGCSILGEDIVHHNINDILVQGGQPLFFLDYFASSLFNPEYFQYFMTGVVKACKKYGIALIGGETAEMPGTYRDKEHDIVGTLIGVVERKNIINGKKIKKGDLVLSIPSHGIHTNGYSLLNKVFKHSTDVNTNTDLCNLVYGVHRCYLDEINKLLYNYNKIEISGLCHITGGGLIDNPKRILPDGMNINYNNFKIDGKWKTLQERTGLTDKEMMRTFNCGVGMMIIVDPSFYDDIQEKITDIYKIGVVE
jgi:phosphoribosylformylglycinamidine cyclo-ligase